MAGTRYLLDTCLVSELLRPALDAGVLKGRQGRCPRHVTSAPCRWPNSARASNACPPGKRMRGLAQALGQFLAQTLADRVLPF